MTLIALDPGHGGRKRGTRSLGVDEAEYVLEVCRYAERIAQSEGYGAGVALIRRWDTEMTLQARGGEARALGATAVISVHVNAFSDTKMRGAMGFFPRGDIQGRRIAMAILDAMPAELQRKRNRIYSTASRTAGGDGWLQPPHNVLSPHSVPCCLIELGFGSNPKDREYMLESRAYKEQAEAIFEGIRLASEI